MDVRKLEDDEGCADEEGIFVDRAEDTEMAGVVEVVACEPEPARGGRGDTARWASFQLVGMGAVLER